MKKRNFGLDFLKFICAFMVICIHANPPGLLDAALTSVSRVAVPIFLMITGYYYTAAVQKNKQTKQIIKIAKLALFANLVYLVFDIFINLLKKISIGETLAELFSLRSLAKFILLNESPFGVHLWYLGALLYALIIVFLWEKKWDRRKLYPIVPVLLLADIVFGKYSLLLFGNSIPYILLRNFLFVGLPYFLLGDMLFVYKPKFTTKKLAIGAAVFTVTTILERLILTLTDLNAERDHYISSTFLAVCLFLLAIQCGNDYSAKWYKQLCFYGAEFSLIIYIIHPMIIQIMNKIIHTVSSRIEVIDTVYRFIEPIFILVLSVAAAYLIKFIGSRINLPSLKKSSAK